MTIQDAAVTRQIVFDRSSDDQQRAAAIERDRRPGRPRAWPFAVEEAGQQVDRLAGGLAAAERE